MATPTVAATNSGWVNGTASPHTVNLPAGIAAGDRLIVLFALADTRTVTTPAGWTLISNVDNPAVFGSSKRLYAFTKVASGSEGATLSLTISGSTSSAHTSYRISGASQTTDPYIAANAGALSTHPDPPALTPGTTDDFLWIACEANAGLSATARPTGAAWARRTWWPGSTATAATPYTSPRWRRSSSASRPRPARAT